MSKADDDRLHLSQRLVLEAGRLMENVSLEFALAMPDAAAVAAQIEKLDQLASDLLALAAAAHALLPRAD